MDASEFKTRMQKLVSRKNAVENEITKINANYEMKVKELKDEFGIEPDEIEGKKSELKEEISTLETTITTDMGKLEAYITALEGKVNAAKSK